MALFTSVDAQAGVGVNVQTRRVNVQVQAGGMHGMPGNFGNPYQYGGGYNRGYRRGVHVGVHVHGRCGRGGCRSRMRIRGRCGQRGCGGGGFAMRAGGGCGGGGFDGQCGMPSMRRFSMNLSFGGGRRGGGCGSRSRCF